MHLKPEEQERFNTKWVKSGDCHLWQGPLDRDGYGSFYLRRLGRRAHRVAWFSIHGEVPEGMVVNHTCRKRNCVNPQHLQIITAIENSLKDSCSVGYINSQKTHCKFGHPFDLKYGRQRYCSICSREKSKRLKRKWRMEDTLRV